MGRLIFVLLVARVAVAGESDCCMANGTPGCDDPECEAAICAFDSFCCDVEWDEACANSALNFCGDLCPPPPDCLSCEDTEGEACGDDANGGGCGGTPQYGSVACGETICGNAWADGGTRDTDWFLIELTQTTTVSGILSSEFDGQCFIVDGIAICQPEVVGRMGSSTGCEPVAGAVATIDPGEYVVFVSTTTFEGVPCGSGINDYELTVSCDAECPADVTGDGVIGVSDLVAVIVAWGECDGPCPEDVDGDGDVGVLDLVQVVVEWGPC